MEEDRLHAGLSRAWHRGNSKGHIGTESKDMQGGLLLLFIQTLSWRSIFSPVRWASTQNMVMMKVNYRTVCLQKSRPQRGLSLN